MRQPFPGDDLPGNLRNHLGEEIKDVIRTVDGFLEHELPSGAVRNLHSPARN